MQERLTNQIATCIQDLLNPKGVAIIIEAQHMCMQMRGVEKKQSYMSDHFIGKRLVTSVR